MTQVTRTFSPTLSFFPFPPDVASSRGPSSVPALTVTGGAISSPTDGERKGEEEEERKERRRRHLACFRFREDIIERREKNAQEDKRKIITKSNLDGGIFDIRTWCSHFCCGPHPSSSSWSISSFAVWLSPPMTPMIAYPMGGGGRSDRRRRLCLLVVVEEEEAPMKEGRGSTT